MGTTQGMPQKGIILGKELSRKFSNVHFARTGAILWNQISPDWRDLSKPIFKKTIRRFLFETFSVRDDYVEVDTLTQVLKFSSLLISTHSLVYL